MFDQRLSSIYLLLQLRSKDQKVYKPFKIPLSWLLSTFYFNASIKTLEYSQRNYKNLIPLATDANDASEKSRSFVFLQLIAAVEVVLRNEIMLNCGTFDIVKGNEGKWKSEKALKRLKPLW